MNPLKFITDQEVDFKEVDYLNSKVYAQNLENIVQNCNQTKVFTIGLYGNWGVGKSSIIATVKKNIESSKIKFVTYDAWQYSNDSFRRMFLRCLSKELKYSETEFMQRFYENQSRDLDNEFKLSYTKSVYVLIGLLCILFILSFFKFEIEYKISIFSIITLLGTLVALFSGVFHQLKVSVTKPYIFAPEQFEDCFKEIVSHALKANSYFKKSGYFNSCDKSIKNLDKLVIVIDNIDRCPSKVAYQLLSDIKTFFSDLPFNVVFIIPVDDQALSLEFLISGAKGHEKEEFLRKIFNVTLRIKPFKGMDMFKFTQSICEQHQIQLKPETLNIIGQEYSRNPRRVIQLLNNLLVEFQNYEESFVKDNETIICVFLILREDYESFYERIIENTAMLLDSKLMENIYNDEQKKESLKRFLNHIKIEVQHVNYAVINKILLNTDNHFIDLPIELLEASEINEYEKVIPILEQPNVNFTIYSEYLCGRLESHDSNELWNELARTVELISVVNDYKEFDNVYILRIYNLLKSNMGVVINRSLEKTNVFKLIEFETTVNQKYDIKNTFTKTCLLQFNKDDKKEHWVSIINAALRYFDDQTIANGFYDFYYNHYNHSVGLNELQPKTFECFIKEPFIDKKINGITTYFIDNEEYQDIKYIFQRSESHRTYIIKNLLDRLSNNNSSVDFIGERVNYLEILSDFINTLVENKTEIKFGIKTIDKLLEKLFHPITEEKNGVLINPDFVLQLKKNLELFESTLQLIQSLYQLSIPIENLKSYILKLNDVNRIKIVDFILELKEKDEDINFYFPEIIDIIDNSTSTLELKRYYLTSNDKIFFNQNKDAIIQEISGLINQLNYEEENVELINKILQEHHEKMGEFECISKALKHYTRNNSGNESFYFLEKLNDVNTLHIANGLQDINIGSF